MVFTRHQSKAAPTVGTSSLPSLEFPQTPTRLPTKKHDSKSVGAKANSSSLTYNGQSFIVKPAKNATTTAETCTDSVEGLREQKTPQQALDVKPSRNNMHPQMEKKSSKTPHEASEWLGFFNLQPQTEPRQVGSKLHNVLPESPTPIKVKQNITTTSIDKSALPSYEFTFRREASVQLSAEARQIMQETRAEASVIRAKLAAEAAEKTLAQNESANLSSRKMAHPTGRFSDVHSVAFKKMDSIANHASAWRTNTKRDNDFEASKQLPSKSHGIKGPLLSTLKRSRSKADLGLSASDNSERSTPHASEEQTRSAKRLKQNTSKGQESLSMLASSRRLARSALHTPTKSSLARSKSATNLKKTQIPALVRHQISSPAKPTTLVKNSSTSGTSNPAFLAPTKSSLQRNQEQAQITQTSFTNTSSLSASYDETKNPATPKSVIDSPAGPKVTTPTPGRTKNVATARPLPPPPLDSPRPISSVKIKSILRTPVRLYSNDPAKIAAGTHMATPPSIKAPATAPVTKRVVFSASARLKAAMDEARAGSDDSEVPYPQLPNSVPHNNVVRNMGERPNIPGDFTFRVGTEIKFGSPASSTIRAVRSSDQSPTMQAPRSNSKRKLDDFEMQSSLGSHDEDKENSQKDGQERPVKRMRNAQVTQSKTANTKAATTTVKKSARKPTAAPSAAPRSVKRAGGLSASRLAFLSQPKKR